MKYLEKSFKVCPGYTREYRDNYDRIFNKGFRSLDFERKAKKEGTHLVKYKGEWYWADENWNWFGPYDLKLEALSAMYEVNDERFACTR